VNELFQVGFEPKDNQKRPFNICYATRFSSPKQDLVKALSSKHPKRASLLIIMPLNLLQKAEQAEKLKTSSQKPAQASYYCATV
jgi:hypothetical protein